jgi:hypothetical protein
VRHSSFYQPGGMVYEAEKRREAEKGEAPASPSSLPHICAWCPDFDPKDLKNAGASHGICPSCAARWKAEAAQLQAEEEAGAEALALLHGSGEEE